LLLKYPGPRTSLEGAGSDSHRSTNTFIAYKERDGCKGGLKGENRGVTRTRVHRRKSGKEGLKKSGSLTLKRGIAVGLDGKGKTASRKGTKRN